MKLVITGGHHTSAIPIIKRLRKDTEDTKIFWFGHKYSQKNNKNPTLEFTEIKKLNIPFYNLIAGKFYRTYDPIRLLKIPFGFFHAFYLLLKVKPDVILSLGGYLSVPTVFAGFFLGIPSITHEQTLVPGYANRVISKFVKKILISWPSSAKYFPVKKTIVTGLPLRHEIYSSNSDKYSVNEALPTIYITCGKEGSHIINLVVNEALGELLQFCNIIHQCGAHSKLRDIDLLKETYAKIKENSQGKYNVSEFIFDDSIGEAFSKSDLLLIRAGAHTCAEAIVLEKPAILIPIPWVSHDEQTKNANVVKNSGLGIILEQNQLSAKTLINMVKHVLDHKNKMVLKDKNLKLQLQKDVAGLIVAQVKDVVKKKPKKKANS